jgi:hypothetical protein
MKHLIINFSKIDESRFYRFKIEITNLCMRVIKIRMRPTWYSDERNRLLLGSIPGSASIFPQAIKVKNLGLTTNQFCQQRSTNFLHIPFSYVSKCTPLERILKSENTSTQPCPSENKQCAEAQLVSSFISLF